LAPLDLVRGNGQLHDCRRGDIASMQEILGFPFFAGIKKLQASNFTYAVASANLACGLLSCDRTRLAEALAPLVPRSNTTEIDRIKKCIG
jgi:hypothetical protein